MKKELKYLVIHCTATPGGREVSADEIRAWHTAPKPKGNGWKEVGYTAMIHLNGIVEQLVGNNGDNYVDPWEITNGVAGFNDISQHIVYVGGCDTSGNPTDTRTQQQLAALKKIVLEFHARHPAARIVGHNQLAPKACPSFDVPQWLATIGIIQ